MDKVNLLIFFCTLPFNLLFAYWYSKSYSKNPTSWKTAILFLNLLFLGIVLPMACFALLPQNFGSRPDSILMIMWLIFSIILDTIIRRRLTEQMPAVQHYRESQAPKRELSKKEVWLYLFIGILILISLIAGIAFNIYLKFYHTDSNNTKFSLSDLVDFVFPVLLIILVLSWIIKRAIPQLKK